MIFQSIKDREPEQNENVKHVALEVSLVRNEQLIP